MDSAADKKIKSAFQSVFSKYGFKTSSSKKERYGLEGKYTSEITNKGKVNYCIYTLNLEFNDFSKNESLHKSVELVKKVTTPIYKKVSDSLPEKYRSLGGVDIVPVAIFFVLAVLGQMMW